MDNIIIANSTQQTGTQTIKEATMQATQSPFDINALFSAAVLNAVNAATAPLLERIATLETTIRDRLFGEQPDKYKTSDLDEMSSRLSLLEDKMDNISEATEERIKEMAEEVARDVLSEHNHEYDHDGYDRMEDRIEEKVNDAVSDAIEEIDFEDKVRDIMRHASVSIDI
jgi:AAA+ ATPase superfamily predicted ATPase